MRIYNLGNLDLEFGPNLPRQPHAVKKELQDQTTNSQLVYSAEPAWSSQQNRCSSKIAWSLK